MGTRGTLLNLVLVSGFFFVFFGWIGFWSCLEFLSGVLALFLLSFLYIKLP